jgi:hypothetical protein
MARKPSKVLKVRKPRKKPPPKPGMQLCPVSGEPCACNCDGPCAL